MLGYGLAGLDERPSRTQLGSSVRSTLAESVGMLGWDLRQLQEDRLRAALNVLYGFAPNYAIREGTAPAGPVEEMLVHFHGPFAAHQDSDDRCLFSDDIASAKGVYLWTVNVGGKERVWYVGQTGDRFGKRIGDHVQAWLSGEYEIFDPAALARGEFRRLWPTDADASLAAFRA